jgi:hypothetical protein
MLGETIEEESMKLSPFSAARTLLFSVIVLTLASSLAAAEADTAVQPGAADAQVVSPQAQAVLDRMTASLRALQTFSITSDSTRDEVVAYGYKLQNNEHSTLVVQRPNKLRAEIAGDIRNRTIVYDGAKLAMYSPDDAAYVRVAAPDTLAKMIGDLLDAGVEMPLIDVLYQAADGTLTEAVHSGILVGESTIAGVQCDHLAFRQSNIDWQIWVEQGAKALPRKLLITTRYEVGDPQFEATLSWNLQPKIDKSTFAFTPPKGANELPFNEPAAREAGAP